MKVVGGSMSDDWNNLVANQTTRTLWSFADSDPEEIRRERYGLMPINASTAGDELEGMIAAQLIACSADKEPVPIASDAERSLPDARRAVAGRTER